MTAGHTRSYPDIEQQFLEDNIATVAFHLGQPGAKLSVRSDKDALMVDPGEVLQEISRRLTVAHAQRPNMPVKAERHPGPFIGPDAELARACAMVTIQDYGNDDPDTHQRIMRDGIWNDHVAVQAALTAIHSIRKSAAEPAGPSLSSTERQTPPRTNTNECPSCKQLYIDGQTCRAVGGRGGCPMGGDF